MSLSPLEQGASSRLATMSVVLGVGLGSLFYVFQVSNEGNTGMQEYAVVKDKHLDKLEYVYLPRVHQYQLAHCGVLPQPSNGRRTS